MEKEKTLIQKLDWILGAINANVANDEIKKKYDYNKNELVEILEKLERDGYIKRDPFRDFSGYLNTPTVEGRLFIGYEKQRILENDEITKILNAEKRVEEYETKLYRATLLAGIVAALLLLWQVFLYLYPVHTNYPYFFWHK